MLSKRVIPIDRTDGWLLVDISYPEVSYNHQPRCGVHPPFVDHFGVVIPLMVVSVSS